MNPHQPNYQARCERVQRSMEETGFDMLLVGPSADLLYLIGLNRPQSERLTLLLLPRQGPIRLLMPSLDTSLAEPLATFFEVIPWEETVDPADKFVAALPNRGAGLMLGVASKLFTHFLYRLQEAAPQARFVSGGILLDSLRIRKEGFEIELLAAAGAAADRTLQALTEEPLAGRSEAQVRARIVSLLTEHGHDVAGGAIVGAGANGASPHHHAGKRLLTEGEGVVIDFGGMLGGYWSDMTRTIHIGDPTAEFEQVYRVVQEANQKAFEAARPGVTAEAIDQAAREVIRAAGYGKYFLHRTGHGIGLEIHEPPYLVGGNRQILEEGMAFSIEPGIYLAGKFGVRIEDIVVLTQDGARRFNQYTRSLQVV